MATKFCRHIRTNGERCASPALRSDVFCYFHTELEKRHRRLRSHAQTIPTVLHPMGLQDGSQRDPIPAQPTPTALDLPPLEDRHSIQLALSILVNALARNQVDPKHAALLFYGLQIASSNAYQLNPEPKIRLTKITKTVSDEATGELIAPDEDPEDPDEAADFERAGTATRIWRRIQAEEAEKKRRLAEETAASASSSSSDTWNMPFIPPL